MQYRAKLIGVASLLLCVAFASQALTLGRIRGVALIGQPLNMVVPVQIGAGEDASAACFEAEVFHADARQDPSRVRVAVEPTGQASSLNVRILSSATVDEPVVTVYFRTLCDQKTTRRYVLLADFPSDVGPVIAPSQISVPSLFATPVDAMPAALGVVVAAAEDAASSGASTSAPLVQRKAPVKAKPVVAKKVVSKQPVKQASAPKPAVASLAASTPPEVPSGQPRLTLDSPILLPGQIEALALTPASSPSAEAQRDLLKIQSLESDVKALLVLAAKNEASLLDVRTRLQAAESERLPSWMVYALGVLLLACLAVIALLLRRQRQVVHTDHDRWSASVAAAAPSPVSATSAALATGYVTLPGTLNAQKIAPVEPQPPTNPASAYGRPESPVTQVDVSLLEMSESGFDKLMQSGVAHSAIRKPQPSKPVSVATAAEPHNLNSSAVFDVRQQAEFFVSLGQTDQAVRILEKQISDSDDPNPHVYLDLLAIFHSLSLKVDFRQFREDFNLLFNGRVPEFAAFKDEGQNLESYPAALEAIIAVWPMAKVLGVIESLIFRDPWETGSQPFDLAALRDLLILHAVAHRILLAAPDVVPSALVFGTGTAAHAKSKPYFADSGLDMPLPMPSPYMTAAEVGELGAASDVTGSKEVDFDFDLSLGPVDLDLDLDLDFPAGAGASAAPSAVQDMDLDLSLPVSAPIDFELPSEGASLQRDLMDFDMPSPVQRPKPDDKTPN